MESTVATLQTIALWVLLISIIGLLPAMVLVSSTRRKKQEKEWGFVAKGVYDKVGTRRMIYGSVFTTILFTDGSNCTVVNISDKDLPAPGTNVEIYKTKRGNNFKIETSIPPSSCL
ncbi:MAG TPA: hypothetical protein VJ046_01655 [Candidatus Paceibacterota bacterium]|nr:hypothetical protein [Candidatus Paceibacterota bacterium]